jgi:phosphoserine phosphatase
MGDLSTRVLLLRHGHVAGIVPKRFRGRLDLPLSDEGREQARRARAFVAARYTIVAVYSSPLQRCLNSARELADRFSLPLTAVGGLTDTDYGLWQGRLASDVAREDASRYAKWQDAPGTVTFPEGESLAQVAHRATGTLQSLANQHRGQTIALYSHDSVIRTILLTVLGAPLSTYHRLEVEPCSLTELLLEPQRTEVLRVNERTS